MNAPSVFAAPAKLNLSLLVTGRRADGYHLLQTVFRFIDFADQIHLTVRYDGRIERTTALAGVAADDDLTVRAARLLQQAAGIKINHIAYKGSGQAVIDLVGGHVGIMFGGMSAVTGHAKAGRLKLIAVTGKQRMPIAPEIPTIAESGYPDFEAVGWFGLIAPAKTPKAIISRLNAESVKAANGAEVNKRLTAIGFDIVTSTPDAFALYSRNEFIKWRQLAQKLGLKSE